MRIATSAYKRNERSRAFADTLNALYEWEKANAGNLRWADDDLGNTEFLRDHFPPRPAISVRDNLPKASMRVVAFDGDGPIGEAYAPILMRDVRPLMGGGGDSILGYPITAVRGREGVKPGYPTLGKMFESYEREDGYGKIGATPLVEAIAFVPMDEKKGFVTEFAPEMRIISGEFAFPLIVENSIGAVAVSGPGVRHLLHIDEEGKESLFKAAYVPDMSKFEKWTTVNDQTGHMIVVARPVSVEKEEPRGLYSEFSMDSPSGMRSLSKGLDFSRVKISKGTRVGQGHGVNCEPDKNGLIGVYHFRVIGVKSRGEFEDRLGSVGEALNLG